MLFPCPIILKTCHLMRAPASKEILPHVTKCYDENKLKVFISGASKKTFNSY